MERKAPRCSPDHWRELLVAMNKSDDEVAVSSAALEDVLECHARKGSSFPVQALVIKTTRSTATVRRNQLWDLVQQHGAICESQYGHRPADWYIRNIKP